MKSVNCRDSALHHTRHRMSKLWQELQSIAEEGEETEHQPFWAPNFPWSFWMIVPLYDCEQCKLSKQYTSTEGSRRQFFEKNALKLTASRGGEFAREQVWTGSILTANIHILENKTESSCDWKLQARMTRQRYSITENYRLKWQDSAIQ